MDCSTTKEPQFVKVTSRNLSDPDESHVRVIDWTSGYDHKWLRKHNHWAVLSGYRVTLEPIDTPPDG